MKSTIKGELENFRKRFEGTNKEKKRADSEKERV